MSHCDALDKNSLILVLILVLGLLEVNLSLVAVGHVLRLYENLLLPSLLPAAPMLLRGEAMVLFMVLASSRQAGAPDEVYHRVIMGALQGYWCVLR